MRISRPDLRPLLTAAMVALLPGVLAAGDWYMPAGDRAAQFAAFNEPVRRSVVDFLPFRASRSAVLEDGTPVRLTVLNARVQDWFVLETGREARVWHLENAAPEIFSVTLDTGALPALIVASEAGDVTCRPWEGALDEAAATGLPYAPICDGRLYLRSPGSGSRTGREAVAEFLRGYVPFGENIVTLVKDTFYRDAWMQTSATLDGTDAGDVVEALGRARLASHPVMRANLDVELVGASGRQMEAGAWYAVADAPGVYASVVQPGMIDREILSRRGEAAGLDGVENRADVWLFGFDLAHFELGYEVGTDHPAVNWSPRPSGAGRNASLPGPDGFSTTAPLARTGMLSPALTDRVAAIFAGGFKREHAAWRRGPMATSNHGHHYGFVVHGTVLSRLQPGLATIYALNDGTIGMRAWRETDAQLLPRVRFARQNGVPLIEPHPETGEPVPGRLVRDWMGGNWSGSAEAQLRTLRAGACLREAEGRSFLIYAVFSSVTPSGMARTFQAYGCQHAMLLDMNSLDLTYAAIYTRTDATGALQIHHLDRRMAGSDTRGRDGRLMARFVEYADNRDFIYLLRR
ncbi:hypothetical protein [Pararhodobacter sp. SW119]|uniref:hypothetical protein n=1 Tax=Pararhodobacter sp. SW119 TaxID=2780075 RepID=UPI001AE0D3B1|nr:hypothetical protein [Pararhodobacter sp. SW119]